MARAAPASTSNVPFTESPRAIQSLRGVISWGTSAPVNSVPIGSSASERTTASSARPLQMTSGMPAAPSTRALVSLVIMPPDPTALPAPDAPARISGVMRSTRLMSWADGSVLGFDVYRPSMSLRITTRSAFARHATSAASVSLSPNLICSTDTVSFSFTIGTAFNSTRRRNVSRACRYAFLSAVSRRVSSTSDVSMPYGENTWS